MKAESRKLAGARVGIPPRHVDFRFPDQTRYAFDDNAAATAFLAVLSGIFPAGERFFAESVRRFRDRVTDDHLKACISGFMGQEALHGQQHERLNDYFRAHGFDTRVPDRGVRLGLWLLERLPHKQQLACTALMEHFTARLAQEWLVNEHFRKRTDPEFLKLWQWHALEELEHKSVAYDVYLLLGDDLAERRRALPLVLAALAPGIVVAWAWLVASDERRWNLREHRRGLTLLFGPQGFVRKSLLKVGAFRRADFHPARHDTQHLVREWRNTLFGEHGSLRAQWRNREATSLA
jgi:uncharacterized protein